MKKILPVILILIIALFTFCACDTENGTESEKNLAPFENPGDTLGGGGTATTPETISTTTTETSIENAITVDLTDEKSDTDQSHATTFLGETITTAGDYILSGTYSEGITISVGNKETVHLFLSSATITSTSGIAISNTNKKSDLIITLVDGTTNTVSTSGEDANAIHVKGNLTINGTGTLNVSSSTKNGIKVTKVATMVDATVNITSVGHGITARTIICDNVTFNIEAEKDGIQAECDDETVAYTTEEGYISLKNVNLTTTVQGDSIQADTFVYIDGGTYNLTSIGQFVEKTSSSMTTYDLTADDFRYKKVGTTYQKVASDSNQGDYALSQSAKGIKVGEIKYTDASGTETTVTDGDYYIIIKSGTFTLNTSDDAIHTNSGNLTIDGGTFTITTLDDGITSDGLTKINGGNITITSSYEGIEGSYVEINGGNLDITSLDDGINAASDDTSVSEYIVISGGTVTIDASGDGLDSNGSLLISGGTVTVYGPTTGGDAGMDADSGILINGGTVFVSSSLGMVETPATNSTQYVLSYAESSGESAGSTLTIKNSDGTEIYTVTVKKNCQSIIISLPEFTQGQTYYVYSGDTKITEFTISSTITTVGVSGGMGQGGMNQGGMNQGGMNQGGNHGGRRP